MWYGGPWGLNWFGWGGGIMMILGFILFVIVVFFVFKWLSYTPWHGETRYEKHTSNDESLSILKRRYANGEINKEEYEKIKKDLGF